MSEQSSHSWEELKPSPDAPPPVQSPAAESATDVSANVAGGSATPARAGRTPWRLLELALAVIVVGALVAGLVILKRQLDDKTALEDARSSALAAAQTYAVDIATYDYRHLDQDFGKVTSHATGKFKDQFSKASADLKPLLVQYQGTAKATVHGAGIADATTDKVTVVLFVDQTITNTNSPTPRVDRNRVTMVLVRDSGRWLISQVDLS